MYKENLADTQVASNNALYNAVLLVFGFIYFKVENVHYVNYFKVIKNKK